MSGAKYRKAELLKRRIGKQLRLARLQKNLRQVDIALALEEYGIEMNQSTLGKIERGERNLPVHEFAALVDILDIPVEALLKGRDNDPA